MINRIENLKAINPSAVESDSESLWQHIWAVFYGVTSQTCKGEFDVVGTEATSKDGTH